jgi:hypothetical protein
MNLRQTVRRLTYVRVPNSTAFQCVEGEEKRGRIALARSQSAEAYSAEIGRARAGEGWENIIVDEVMAASRRMHDLQMPD